MADHKRLVYLRMWRDRDRIEQRREWDTQHCRIRCLKLPGIGGTEMIFTQQENITVKKAKQNKKTKQEKPKNCNTATCSLSYWKPISSRAHRDSVKTW